MVGSFYSPAHDAKESAHLQSTGLTLSGMRSQSCRFLRNFLAAPAQIIYDDRLELIAVVAVLPTHFRPYTFDWHCKLGE